MRLSNKSLQPTGLWRCAPAWILISVFSNGAQPSLPERWLSSFSLDGVMLHMSDAENRKLYQMSGCQTFGFAREAFLNPKRLLQAS